MKRLVYTITLTAISTLLLIVIIETVVFYTSPGYNYTAPEFYIKMCTTNQLINTTLSYPKLHLAFLEPSKESSWPPFIKELDGRKDAPEKVLKRFEKCEMFEPGNGTLDAMCLARRYRSDYTEEQLKRFMLKVEMLEMTGFLNN